jgi:hypothetical protein
MYFIKDGDVWRVPRVRKGKAVQQKVARAGIEMDDAFIYFLDQDGDIARAKRVVGTAAKKKKKNTPRGGGAKKRARN